MYVSNNKLIYCMLYVTTNLINGKFYIGVHETKDQNDNYLGSGTSIKKAIKKYGRENFKREVIEFFPTGKDAYEAEAELVTKDLINYTMCYNETLGGIGGWSHVDSSGEKNPMKNPVVVRKVFDSRRNNPVSLFRLRETGIQNIKKAHEHNTGKSRNRLIVDKIAKSNSGQKRSLDARKNMSESAKKRPPVSEETRKKRSEIAKNQNRDMKFLSSLSVKKRKEEYERRKLSGEKYKCIYCGLESLNNSTIVRWHNDNCKHKIVN